MDWSQTWKQQTTSNIEIVRKDKLPFFDPAVVASATYTYHRTFSVKSHSRESKVG